MRLSDALTGLGHAIPYYPRLAETLGSMNAALLLAQLFFWSQYESEDDGWVKKSAKEIEDGVGLTRRQQVPVRERLVELGVVETHKNGEHGTLHYRIDWDGLEALWPVVTKGANHNAHSVQTTLDVLSNDTYIQDTTKTHAGKSDQPKLIMTPVATPERVMDGALDHIPKAKLLSPQVDDLLESLVDYWKRIWGIKDPRVRLNDERRKAFRKAVRDDWKPSDWVKAMRGMRFDRWSDRANHNDWQHIAKNMDKWLRLHDENADKVWWGTDAPEIKNTKVVRGVRVPKDYSWSSSDDYCLENGWTWTGTKWERPAI